MNERRAAPGPVGSRRLAVILSGGGARGAYEVGVLSYIFKELARLRGGAPRIDILSGTSVGAINACYLAAHLADPEFGLRRLVEMWSQLEITRVLGFGARQMIKLPRLVLGGGIDGTGLFDVTPMRELVQREISWRAVTRCLQRRELHALSVSTTEVSTGRTVVFVQTSPDWTLPSTAPPRMLFRADHIGPAHALASAAIPLLFPPVRIDGKLYLDGGLRQNTPIAPALRFGATHIFAIGGSRDVTGYVVDEGGASKGEVQAPGAAVLLGKVLNAFLLDHFDADLDLLKRLNNVIVDGVMAYGDAFVDTINEAGHIREGSPYRYVNCLTVRPSDDIGRLASHHVRKGNFAGNSFLARRLFSLLDIGVATEADLASYLLFDGRFCSQLIEMGRADAHAQRDALLAFFGSPSEDELPPDEARGSSHSSGAAISAPRNPFDV